MQFFCCYVTVYDCELNRVYFLRDMKLILSSQFSYIFTIKIGVFHPLVSFIHKIICRARRCARITTSKHIYNNQRKICSSFKNRGKKKKSFCVTSWGICFPFNFFLLLVLLYFKIIFMWKPVHGAKHKYIDVIYIQHSSAFASCSFFYFKYNRNI